jgi:hypothetical protein
MAEKKEHSIKHVKSPQFVSTSATHTTLSKNPDSTLQIVFSVLVTDLETETMNLSPRSGSADEFEIVGTTFETATVKEDRVRINMAEPQMRELAVLLAGNFGLDGKKSNGGSNG